MCGLPIPCQEAGRPLAGSGQNYRGGYGQREVERAYYEQGGGDEWAAPMEWCPLSCASHGEGAQYLAQFVVQYFGLYFVEIRFHGEPCRIHGAGLDADGIESHPHAVLNDVVSK